MPIDNSGLCAHSLAPNPNPLQIPEQRPKHAALPSLPALDPRHRVQVDRASAGGQQPRAEECVLQGDAAGARQAGVFGRRGEVFAMEGD